MSLRGVLRVHNSVRELLPYAAGLARQEAAVQAVREGAEDQLLLFQHDHVYTLGKRLAAADFPLSPAQLETLGASLACTGRGGEATYHGPGQVVMYPVVNLRRLACGPRAYVEGLEDTIVSALRLHGLQARGRVPGRTGVWLQDRKIAAIGVQVSQGVTRHGLALNVAPDLAFYRHIVPCGLAGAEVTSMARELGGQGVAPQLEQVAGDLVEAFKRTLYSAHTTPRDSSIGEGQTG